LRFLPFEKATFSTEISGPSPSTVFPTLTAPALILASLE